MINSIIPSATIRAYIQQTGFCFTDAELATIIYHSKQPLPVKHRYWKQLMAKTEDIALHQQIAERVAYDQKCCQLFSENDGSYFYETVIGETTEEWEQDDITGHFASLELAIEHAKGLGFSFSVRKYQIVGLCKNIIVPYGLFNPRLFPDSLSDTRPYRGESIAEFRYTAEGILQNFWTYEIPIEETVAVEDWGKIRFEWKFIRMPNPFEEGDCVRISGTDQEGVVATSQVEWNAFLHRVTEQHLIVDYSDASIVVDYSKGKDPYDHNHIQPIYLEKLDNSKETEG